MNIRAERIDQMIQLLNRNLLLISAGQLDGKPSILQLAISLF